MVCSTRWPLTVASASDWASNTNPSGKITFSGALNNNSIEVKVSDSGVGMSQASIDKLFRIDIKHNSKDGTNGEKGTGLGLILCKEFIEKHKGKIWVESEEGKGSKFNFTLSNSKNEK